MQALLLISDELLARTARKCAEGSGYNCITYNDPVKAADNMREIHPDIIAVGTDDFPLHHELVASIVHTGDFRSTHAFFLTRNASFQPGVEKTALVLGVEGCFSNMATGAEAERAFCSHLSAINTDTLASRLVYPETGDKDGVYLMFSHPFALTPVSCDIISLSAHGAAARPDNPELTSDLRSGDIIPDCSLLAGDRLITSSAIVESVHGRFTLVFDGMNIQDRAYLVAYIEKYSRTRQIHSC